MSAIAALVLPGVDPKFAAMKAVVAAMDHVELAFRTGSRWLDVWHVFVPASSKGLLGSIRVAERGVPFCDHHAAITDERLACD